MCSYDGSSGISSKMGFVYFFDDETMGIGSKGCFPDRRGSCTKMMADGYYSSELFTLRTCRARPYEAAAEL